MDKSSAHKGQRYCAVCGRRISANRSVSGGIGPKCRARLKKLSEPKQRTLFEDEEEEGY